MLDLIVLVIRAVQFVFNIICLGLSAYLVDNASESRINFMLFVSVWTFLVIFVLALAPRFLDSSITRIAVVGLDLLTALFWFAGFIALAVLYNNGLATDGFLVGAYCAFIYHGCSTMEADVVFGAFLWALFTVTTILGALGVFRNRGKGGTTTSTGPSVGPHVTA